MSDHYNLWPLRGHVQELRRELGKRITGIIGDERIFTASDALEAYYQWGLQGEPAKFLVNSLRVYEFWGYDWWIPLCDYEFIDFWSKVPPMYRARRSLYKSYVRGLSNNITGVNIPESHSISPVTFFIVECLQRTPMVTMALATYRKIREMKKVLFENYEHPFSWYVIVPKELFARFYTGKEHINSFLAMQILERELQKCTMFPLPDLRVLRSIPTYDLSARPFLGELVADLGSSEINLAMKFALEEALSKGTRQEPRRTFFSSPPGLACSSAVARVGSTVASA